MNKYKYLLKNVGIMTLSNIGSKLLSFILIPLYTMVLTTTEYGIYDICLTTVSLCVPLLTLNIVSAVLRFPLDEEKDKKKIFSIGCRQVFASVVLFGVLLVVNALLDMNSIFEEYGIFMFLLYIGTVMYELLTQYAKALERIQSVAVGGVVNTVSILMGNLFFLLVFKLGLLGYFVANCIGYYCSIAFYIFDLKIWKHIEWKLDIKLKKEMLKYSKPLVLDTVSWWINNVSDRYIVTAVCGTAVNGIYAVAYKLPSVLNIVQAIFNQVWTISATKEFTNVGGSFYSKVYRIYNCGLVITCSVLIIMNKWLSSALLSAEFYSAWRYSPFLMISVVFGGLCGIFTGIFAAAKRTDITGKTTVVGAVFNIVCNLILVRYMGAMGAAIATMITYILIWGIRLFNIKSIVKLDIALGRDIVSYVLLVAQTVILFYVNTRILSISILIVIVFLYWSDWNNVIRFLLDKGKVR